MTSIDELFKKPTIPSNKRKLEVSKDANAAYKATKIGTGGDVKTNGHTTVDDEDGQGNTEAGPELPPEEDGLADDEDGRFFGGGVTKDTADVLDFIEERDKDDAVRDLLNLSDTSNDGTET